MPHPANIPLTPQTNENNFPRWRRDAGVGQSGYAYPRMLTRTCTAEDRAEWKEKNRKYDTASGREYWESAPPRIGVLIPVTTTARMVEEGKCDSVGEPVIVRDEHEELEVKRLLGLDAEPEFAPKVARIPIAPAVLAAAEEPKRKRGRPPKVKAPPEDTPDNVVWVDEASKD